MFRDDVARVVLLAVSSLLLCSNSKRANATECVSGPQYVQELTLEITSATIDGVPQPLEKYPSLAFLRAEYSWSAALDGLRSFELGDGSVRCPERLRTDVCYVDGDTCRYPSEGRDCMTICRRGSWIPTSGCPGGPPDAGSGG